MTLTRTAMLVVLFAWVLTLSAQSWDALQGLKRGDHIRVLDTTGAEQKGSLVGVTPDAVSLATRHGEVTVERTRVRRVQVRSGAKRVRNLMIGVAIGVGVGLAVDHTVGTYFRNETGDDQRVLTYIAPIAVLGGVAAALPAYRTVYGAR